MYDFVHLPTEIRAYRLERDKWIETQDGRRLAKAGDWHAFGVNDIEYVIRHGRDRETALCNIFQPQCQ